MVRRTRLVAFVSCAAVASAMALRSPGFAQTPLPDSPAFRWDAPPDCPSKTDVLAGIAENLGHPVEVRGEASITKPGRYRLKMSLRVGDAETERELFADQCASLGDAAALIAALAIDPEETLRRRGVASPDGGASDASDPSLDAAPLPEASAPAARADVRRPEPAPAPTSASLGFAQLGGSIDSATTPNVAPGLELRAGLSLGWLRPSIALQGALAQETRSTVTSTVGATFALRTAQLQGCFAPFRWRPIEPSLCVSSSIDWVHAAAFGAVDSLSEDVFWVSLGAAFELRAYLNERFFLSGTAGIAAPLVRRGFVISGEGTLYTVPAATFRGSIGPAIAF